MPGFADRAKETSTSTGTGNFTLAGAMTGFQTLNSAFGVGPSFYYCIEGVDAGGTPTGEWEVGSGVLSGSTTLVRTSVLANSAGTQVAISFSAGTKRVFCTLPAAAIVTSSGSVTNVFQTNITDFKDSVDVATTANISLTGEQTIDGVLTSASRILVKNQTTASQNGIYVTASGSWSRATDADADAEVTSGMLVYVELGSTNAGKIFALQTQGTITVGTTSLTFAEIVLPVAPEVIVAQSGASYTLAATDNNKWIKGTRATAQTITLPNASTKLPVNGVVWVEKYGAGDITLAPDSGVTIRSPRGLVISKQYGVARIKKIGNNEYLVTILDGLLPGIGKQTIFVPASAMVSATTNGPSSLQAEQSTNKQNTLGLSFDGTTAESAHFQIAMPKSWDLSTLTFKAYWYSSATDTDGVAWGLEAAAISDNEAMDSSWGTQVIVIDNAQSNASEMLISAESAAVTVGGTPAAEDLIFFRVARAPANGSDTHAEDATLLGIKLYYTTNAENDA